MIGISAKDAKESLCIDHTDIIDKFKDIADELITLIIRNACIDDSFVFVDFDKFTLDVLDECKEQDVSIETIGADSVVNYLVIDMIEQLRSLGFKCEWSYKNTYIKNARLFISWCN